MAWSKTPWSAKNGLGFGLVAGLVFALAECLASLFGGTGVLEPLRYAASVALGSRALMDMPLGLTAIAGLGIHLVLSAFFGLAYSLVDARMAVDLRPQGTHQSAMGMLFALGVWVVTFQFISRGYYPWFLSVPQFFQLVLHAVFYGLPLGLLFAAAERRRVALAEFEQRAFEEGP
ncbi:hypothetical protein POL68_24485 [Stigmatella sp. ncwal1]|uniref:Uncharacterized protein n=1 Tax=Stigmatella ashevillensis TaxID=2995309 RepID=A0ABT5DDH0_9BACT|nr:hypothetical protein [Stigmatella ashevillena]MDC0711649.1 hypothetical protein [Stigmatella ashevillena]